MAAVKDPKKPKKKKRTKARVDAHRRRVSQLYLAGYVQAEIAVELQVSQATVSRTLAGLRTEWQSSSLMDFNERKAQELAKVDNLELEYWTAWKRSQTDALINTKKAVRRGKDTVQEATERTEGQAGDARFLQGVQWCIDKRCEILGINAPKREERIPINPEDLSQAQLERLIKGESVFSVLAHPNA